MYIKQIYEIISFHVRCWIEVDLKTNRQTDIP